MMQLKILNHLYVYNMQFLLMYTIKCVVINILDGIVNIKG